MGFADRNGQSFTHLLTTSQEHGVALGALEGDMFSWLQAFQVIQLLE